MILNSITINYDFFTSSRIIISLIISTIALIGISRSLLLYLKHSQLSQLLAIVSISCLTFMCSIIFVSYRTYELFYLYSERLRGSALTFYTTTTIKENYKAICLLSIIPTVGLVISSFLTFKHKKETTITKGSTE